MTFPPSPADDVAIERLLRDFFAREMPPELRPLSALAPVHVVRPVRNSRRLLVGSIAALTACGLIVVTASGRLRDSSKKSDWSNAWVAGPKGSAGGPEGHASTEDDSRGAPSVRGHAYGLGPATPADSAGGAGSGDLDAGPLFVVEAGSPVADGTLPTSVQPGGIAGGAPASLRLLDPHTGERIEFVVPEDISSGPSPFGRGRAGSSGPPPPDVRLPEERTR